MTGSGDTVRIKAVLFDFGGVLAEEGFENGLRFIAKQAHLDPDSFFSLATEAVYGTGYVTGTGTEHDFWDFLRQQTGLTEDDAALSNIILERFIIRPGMLTIAKRLRRMRYTVAILSDQSDWLDRLDRRDHFFKEFELVLNSYHLGKTKRDPSVFIDAANLLQHIPEEILFVDDNPAHVARASQQGLQTCLFKTEQDFRTKLRNLGILN